MKIKTVVHMLENGFNLGETSMNIHVIPEYLRGTPKEI